MSMLYGYGNGCMCQLGQSKAFNTHKPIEITLQSIEGKLESKDIGKIQQISCGCYHTIVKTTTNNIFTWGVNDEGALGRSTNEETPLIVELSNRIGKIKKVVTTGDASFILTSNGDLFGCGTFKSSKGLEGFNTQTKKEMEFTKIKSTCKFTDVVGGGAHILLISNDNHVYGIGSSEYGQLIVKERLSDLRKLTYRKSNYFNKDFIKDRIQLKPKERILKVFAGTYTSFIKTSRRIIAFGRNTCAELGIKEPVNKYVEILKNKAKEVIKIKGGEGHTLFLMRSGDVYASGNNIFGQCGTGNNTDLAEPTLINTSFNGEMISDIQANGNFSVLLTATKKFITFGLNTSGELGYSQDEQVRNVVRETPFALKKLDAFSIGNDFVIFNGEIQNVN